MTTGATGQLGLALPVQGELSGTWGDTVNNGITQYTNIAIAGTLTLTGDGAVTLANTTGDASASNITSTLAGAGTVTAQFAIVRVSGTTTTKVVTGPSYSKTYVVDNASSYAVTFKASGQTGVSVAAAEKVTVVFNGTDYIKLAGTIANAAGSNTQIQFNNGGLFGASSSLTWDGTTLSTTQINITGQGTLRLQDTTGGEYVGLRSPSALGASYTLTFPADDGTSGQALITDGSGVLSWSTAASGDVYGPASATDNAVARFDSTTGKIIQNSVVIVGDTGDVSGVGTLSAATLTLTNALGTAYGGTGLTSFTSGGVVYASSSSALATGSALTFDGTSILSNLNTSSAPRYRIGYNSSTYADWYRDASTGNYTFESQEQGSAFIWSLRPSGGSATEAMRLTSTSLYTASGINVGIGTSSPTARLTVNTGVSNEGEIRISDNATYYAGLRRVNATDEFRIGSYGSSQNITFYTVSSERVRIDASGNVGIGVTPSASNTVKVLEIGQVGNCVAGLIGDSGSYLTSNAYYNSGWKYATSSKPATQYSSTGGVHAWYNAPSGTAGNPITFTQAMTLTSGGDWLLKTTSKYSSAIATISGGQNGVNQSLALVQTDNTSFHDKILFVNTGGVVGSISTTGSVTAYAVSSDYRLKNITGPITNSGAYIDSLKPVEGTWKADGSTFVGLIAHEVQESSRTIVATGTKDGEEMQGMDYSSAEIIANLIAEIQSLRKRLADAGI